MRLQQILVESAETGLRLQRSNGSFPSGHNGPWNDIDTPVRTTAHWAMVFLKAFEISRLDRFRKAATSACDYLLSMDARPYQRTFYCRKSGSGKDLCNGLIGQAWAVEPLLVGGRMLKNNRYLDVAVEVLKCHPYDEQLKGWYKVEVNGSPLGYCYTINQQIWFAVMALLAGEYDKTLRGEAIDFFTHISTRVEFLKPGLIKHTYQPDATRLQRWKYMLSQAYQSIRIPHNMRRQERFLFEVSEGYQAFLLYGLAIAVAYVKPDRLVSITELCTFIKPAVEYIIRNSESPTMMNNRFAWGYNPVGFEIGFILQIFGEILRLDAKIFGAPEDWVQKQLDKHYDKHQSLLCVHAQDPTILSSRIYEVARLNECNHLVENF